MTDHVAESFLALDKLMDDVFNPKPATKPRFTYYSADMRDYGYLHREDGRASAQILDAVQVGTGDDEDYGSDLHFSLPAYRDLIRADDADEVWFYDSSECRWEQIDAIKWGERA